MKKIIVLCLFAVLALSLIGIVSAENCTVNEDCVLKDTPYCCGNRTEYFKSCYQINETPKEVNCASQPYGCPGIVQVDYCECENNTCVGKGNETEPKCQNLYWIDNDNKNCSQKEFCGTYMYLGLQTFASKTQCEKALNESENKIEKPKNITFIPWQKRNASECPIGCKCVGAVVSCTTVDGKIMTIEAGRSGNIITITVDKKEANTTLELETEADSNNKTKLKAKLSNNRKAEIKIMPETASATAIAKLGDLGFTIELKEVGKETTTTSDDGVVYELTGNKEGKFLGIFKIMARVQAQVDAEDGNVKVIKPWWSFLASGV